jgi:hypothetical protein
MGDTMFYVFQDFAYFISVFAIAAIIGVLVSILGKGCNWKVSSDEALAQIAALSIASLALWRLNYQVGYPFWVTLYVWIGLMAGFFVTSLYYFIQQRRQADVSSTPSDDLTPPPSRFDQWS